MSTPEQNYEIHDTEMLAIIRALEEWRAELEGLQRDERFDVLTDHQALEYFMTTRKLSARQARWAEFLSRFYFMIRYRPGKQNTIADILPRTNEMPEDKNGHRVQVLLKPECLDKEIQRSQGSITLAPIGTEETVIERVKRGNRSSPSLEEYRELARKNASDWKLEGEQLIFNGRLVVPNEGDLKTRLLDEIHRQPSTAHPGREKTQRLLKERFTGTLGEEM
jgi:RNase H-like domain found in reverse transcriptase